MPGMKANKPARRPVYVAVDQSLALEAKAVLARRGLSMQAYLEKPVRAALVRLIGKDRIAEARRAGRRLGVSE
jgi:hypothetical protein